MCDCLVALPPATGTLTLFAKSSDRPPAEPQDLEWHPPRRDQGLLRVTHVAVDAHREPTLGVLVSRPRWCWGVEHGVNEAGVAIGNEAIYTTLDPRGFPPALTGMDLVRLGLERAASAREAVTVMVDKLERYGQGGTGHDGADRPYWSSFLVADPHDAWVLETSGTTWAAEEVTRVRAISNRTTIPAFDAAHRHPRQPVAELVDPRWEASKAVLAAEPVTVASLQAHQRSHGQSAVGWDVCMHVPGVEATTASMVAELADAPVAWCLLGSPCRSLYLPVRVGEPLGPLPAWERFAALGPQHRDDLDRLERWLADERPPAVMAAAAARSLLDRLGC